MLSPCTRFLTPARPGSKSNAAGGCIFMRSKGDGPVERAVPIWTAARADRWRSSGTEPHPASDPQSSAHQQGENGPGCRQIRKKGDPGGYAPTAARWPVFTAILGSREIKEKNGHPR